MNYQSIFNQQKEPTGKDNFFEQCIIVGSY